MSFYKKSKGFTLIELLIIIAIMGVLSSVILVSVKNMRSKARDAQRKSEIRQIKTAIELYILENGVAPDLGEVICQDPNAGDTSTCTANETSDYPGGKWQALQTQLAPYISALPKDPCGINCYDEEAGDAGLLKYYGYFAYQYQGPGALTYLNNQTPGSATPTSYVIYAQNLESQTYTSFGFGPGSY